MGSSIGHCSAPRTAPLSTTGSSFQHHGQLLLSTAQRHPCPGPPGTRRCGERPGALPGGCLRSTVGAVPTPSDEEGTQGLGREQTVSSLAGNALLRLPLGLWSLFIQAERREGDVDKEIQPCLRFYNRDREIDTCVSVCSGGKEVHSLYWDIFFSC